MSLLRGLLRAAERGGVPSSTLLRAASIEADVPTRDDARLSVRRFELACELAVDLTGDDAFGLHWAESLRDGSFGPIAESLSHAGTLRRAFQLLARFEKFFTSAASHQVVEGTSLASIRVESHAGRPAAVRRTLAEMSTAWFVGLMRAIRPDVGITSLEFAYEAPSYGEEYARVFGLPASFGRVHTQIVLPRGWLDARATAEVASDARAGAAAASSRTAYAPRLHQLILEHAPARISMRGAARELNVHERSLRRYLAAEGWSFKQVEFAALAVFAKQLLIDDQQTVEQTASAMGFAQVITFQRAFKRWTGLSPKSARTQRAQAGQGG